jgi:hypothetical protein
MRYLCFVITTALWFAPSHAAEPAQPVEPIRDVVIYGGTSGAVVAGVRAAMLGASVVLISPDKHLGGLSSGGLGYTDSGNTRAIGGLAREFYRRIFTHYQHPEAWNWQQRESFSYWSFTLVEKLAPLAQHTQILNRLPRFCYPTDLPAS